MDDAGTLADKVKALVARFTPHAGLVIADDMQLSDGLGFDSVRVVELLLACEDELGVALPVDDVLSGPPLTVARLIAAVADAAGVDRSTR